MFSALVREHPKAPSDEGKRSAVAVVNDSPVGCQSCDRARRSELSAKLTEGEIKMCVFLRWEVYFTFSLPQSRRVIEV